MIARLSALLLLCLAACKPQTATTTLRVSMIPTTDPSKATREMQPLIDYLGKQTGAKVEMTIPTNYAAVVEALVNDQVDVAQASSRSSSATATASSTASSSPNRNLRSSRSPI